MSDHEKTAEHPHIGEKLYTDPDQTGAVQIVRREGTTVWYVPFYTNVRGTHQGNLYDADGGQPYRV